MRQIYLIARREYLAYVMAWGFWLSLISGPLLIGLVALGPLAASRAEPPRAIAILSDDAADGAAVKAAIEEARGGANGGSRYIVVKPPAGDLEGLRPYLTGAKTIALNGSQQALFAAFAVNRNEGKVTLSYWSTNLIDGEPRRRAANALSERMRNEALAARGLTLQETEAISRLGPAIEQFDPRAKAGASAVTAKDRAPYLAAAMLALALWSSVFGVANMLLTGVVEEKSNKILDQLLTRASPLQILMGKLFGVAMVSATLFGVWGGLGAAASTQALAMDPEGRFAEFAGAAFDPALLGLFAVCFVAGYLMFGALFLGLGALCDSLQEAQSLIGPVVFLLILPILLLGPALDNPDAPLVKAVTWIPLFTPFLLMMRAPAGLEWAEMAGPGVLLALTVVVILVLSARLFRAGAVDNLSAAGFRRALWPFKRAKPARAA
jgi:ABC-2 type transport system permease protein